MDDLKRMMREIRDLTKLELKNLVSFKMLHSLKLGETFEVDGSISIVIDKGEDYITFKTLMPVGTHITKHWHDAEEQLKVLNGVLGCEISDDRWTVGHTCTVPPLICHAPFNAGDTELVLETILEKNKIK
jgi:oxalate decarboxylase/phosphoglucose isomerase-like protein (cupin superfamily)